MKGSELPFGRIEPPFWDDKPVIIVGAGPSLKGFDFERLRGLGHIVGVNEAMFDLPFASAGVSIDIRWINERADRLRALTFPRFLVVPGSKDLSVPLIDGATYLRRERYNSSLLSEDPAWIESGCTSGFATLGIAYLKRARFVALFGFDYGGSADGDHYCPTRYEWYVDGLNTRYWPRWGSNFRATVPQLARAGVKVINASLTSSVDAFPRCSHEQAIQAICGVT